MHRINGGFKGVDPVGDIACPDIDFLTLHVCELPIIPGLMPVVPVALPHPCP